MPMQHRTWPSGLALILFALACAPSHADPVPAPRTAYELLNRVTYPEKTLRGMYDNLGGDQENGYAEICASCQTQMNLWGTEFGFSTHPNEHVDYRYKIFDKAKALATAHRTRGRTAFWWLSRRTE